MKKRILIYLFLSVFEFLNSQCIIICNTNAGINSNDNASTIGYDNMGSGFHSTYVREQYGSRVWGENMANDGTSNLLSPIKINSSNYPAMTGVLYHVAIGSNYVGNEQLIVLTSTGLFVSGTEGVVLSYVLTSNTTFQKLTVNGKADGLPIGVTPNDVKMMFVTTKTIIITTCEGNVFVLTQNSYMKGNMNVNSGLTWSQVMESSTTPLTNVIATRGNGGVAFALKSDSTIWTWGSNVYKGDGTSPTYSYYAIQMTKPSGLGGIKMIQATTQGGNSPSYYILGTDKKVYTLGDNDYGQLGDNTTTTRLVWVNCKNPDNSIINNAAWISTNEHDEYYANLALIKTNGQAFTCGYNSGYMIGRSQSEGVNYLSYPAGITASDTILYCEQGGHTTAFIKKNTVRYGYVGHRINGSLGNGDVTSDYLSAVDFITPPIINVCGTTCDTPQILKLEYDCATKKATFIIKSIYGSKIKYRVNSGAIDSVIIGLGDTSHVIVMNPTVTPILTILQFTNLSNTCNLILNVKDSLDLIGNPGVIVNQSKFICFGSSYFYNGDNLTTSGIYYDTITSSLGCTYIHRLNLSINNYPTYSINTTPVSCKDFYSGKAKITNLTGKTPYTFEWSNGSISDSIIDLSSGKYFVTVTDANGCAKSDSTILTTPVTFSVNETVNHILCNGKNSGKAKLTPNKTGTFTFKWSNGSTKDSIVNLTEGNYFYTVTDANLCQIADYIVINESPPIIKSSIVESIKCFGETNGKITLKYSGITPPYSYIWDAPISSTLSTISNLSKGDYSVKITDSFGCINYDTFTIIEPVKLKSTIVIDKKIVCYGMNEGQVTVSTTGGTGNYRYNLGNGNQSSPTFSNLKSGSYIVTITDDNNCTDTVSFKLIEPSKLEFNLSKINSSCIESKNGKAYIKDLKGGEMPYAFLWSNGSTADSAILLTGNSNINITVTDNLGCKLINTIYISTDYILTVNLRYDSITCFGGSDGKSYAIPQNGYSPYTYSWNSSPNQTTNPAISLSYGIITVTTTDVNGCRSINSISVEQKNKIKINFDLTLPSCYLKNDGSIKLLASGGYSPYTFTWLNLASLVSDTASNLAPKKYIVEAKDSKNCIVKDSVNLPNTVKTVQVKLIEKKDIQCFGFKNGSIKISADGGTEPYTYKWAHTSLINQTFLQNLSPYTSYKLTVSDHKTCFDTASFILTEPKLLELNFSDVNNATCFDKYDGQFRMIIKGGTKPYRFSFDSFKSEETSYSFQGLKPKWYHVDLIDKNLCKLSKDIQITSPEELKVKITALNDTIDCCSSTSLLAKLYTNTGIIPIDYSYQWTPSTGLTCSDCPDPIVNSYVSRKYPLIVYYNNNKCKAFSDIYIHVNKPAEVFIPNAFTPNGDKLNDIYQFYGNCIASSNLSIFNRWGEKIYESKDRFLGWDASFKGKKCDPGVYSYILFVTYMNQEVKKYTGEFLLIK